jgi:DNA-binding transcriptional ArsR family regulator
MDDQRDEAGEQAERSGTTEAPHPLRPTDRHIDLAALKVMAHPLRVRILDELSKFGPLTASGLAERLGESSGATSYHLRQLAKHDFVLEVEGKGSARERWWRRAPVGLSMDPTELGDTPGGREAYDLVNREFRRNQEHALEDFMARGTDLLPEAWMKVSTISTSNLRMTAAELEAFSDRVYAVLDEVVLAFRDREVPTGARPVQVQFNAFPIIGGVEQS